MEAKRGPGVSADAPDWFHGKSSTKIHDSLPRTSSLRGVHITAVSNWDVKALEGQRVTVLSPIKARRFTTEGLGWKSRGADGRTKLRSAHVLPEETPIIDETRNLLSRMKSMESLEGRHSHAMSSDSKTFFRQKGALQGHADQAITQWDLLPYRSAEKRTLPTQYRAHDTAADSTMYSLKVLPTSRLERSDKRYNVTDEIAKFEEQACIHDFESWSKEDLVRFISELDARHLVRLPPSSTESAAYVKLLNRLDTKGRRARRKARLQRLQKPIQRANFDFNTSPEARPESSLLRVTPRGCADIEKFFSQAIVRPTTALL